MRHSFRLKTVQFQQAKKNQHTHCNDFSQRKKVRLLYTSSIIYWLNAKLHSKIGTAFLRLGKKTALKPFSCGCSLFHLCIYFSGGCKKYGFGGCLSIFSINSKAKSKASALN